MPLLPDTILHNRYHIREPLAAGGFGSVYAALDTTLNRPCAVKENLDADAEAQKQFEQEAQLLAQLRHPNLVQVFDFFAEPGGAQYLVMEYVRGENLATKVEREGALSPAQVNQWYLETLDAVAYLHNFQPPIVHRDVKPGNIVITPQGQAVLVDFGIAKTFVPGQKTARPARAVTPAFSPPEQYGTGTDPRSDIYALGATLYFILTGALPAESVDRLFKAAALQNPRALNPELPLPLEQVILKAMALQPEARYQSAGEMKAALLHPAAPFGDRLPCPNCGKLNRPTGKFCSYCGNPMMAQPAFRIAARPAIAGPLQIPLTEGLGSAKAALFDEQRGARIQNIINDILHRQFTTKGATFMLRGVRGCGMTRVAHAIRDELQRDKSANLVAILSLRERQVDEQDARLVEEFMWGLKENSGPISQKMSKTVTRYVKDYVHEFEKTRGEQETETELEFSFPKLSLELPAIPTPLGGLNLFEIRRTKKQTRRPTPGAAEPSTRGDVLFRALRELVDYLIAEHARVVLIVDGLADLQQLSPLRSLTKMQQVFIITLVERERLLAWQADPVYAELLSDFGREEFYLGCHWDLAAQLLKRMTMGRPEADNPAFERFIKHVQFRGAGLPAQIIRALRPYYSELRVSPARAFPFRQKEQITYTLQVPADEHPLIFAAAEWQDFLNAHWVELLTSPTNSRVIGIEATDAAKVAVYRLCHWLFEQAQNGEHPARAEVLTYATMRAGLHKGNQWIATNLMEWLQREQIAVLDRDERLHFAAALDQ